MTGKVTMLFHIMVKCGDIGSYYYIIQDGIAIAETAEGKFLRELKSGDAFGEIALMKKTERTATVRVKESLKCLTLPGWGHHIYIYTPPPGSVLEQIEKMAGVYHVSLCICKMVQNSTLSIYTTMRAPLWYCIYKLSYLGQFAYTP